MTWEPLTRETIDATQAAIEQTVGFNRDTFRASSLLLQGAQAFPDRSPAERKALLGKILGLERWEARKELATAARRKLDAEAAVIAGRVQAREHDLEQLPAVERAVADAIQAHARAGHLAQAAEQALLDAETEYRQLDARAQERRVAEAEVQAARAALAPLEDALARAVDARHELAVVEDELGALTTAEQAAEVERAYAKAVAEYEQAKAERDRLDREAAELYRQRESALMEADALSGEYGKANARADELEAAPADTRKCPTCDQLLSDPDARRRVIASHRAEAEEIEKRITVLNERAAELVPKRIEAVRARDALGKTISPPTDAVRRARLDLEQRARLEERKRHLREVVEHARDHTVTLKIIPARNALDDAEKRLAALPPVDREQTSRVQHAMLAAKAELEQHRRTLQQAGEDRARARAELERLRALAELIATDRADRDALLARIDDHAILERAYGRDGIPAWWVETFAVPFLETEASRILSELGAGCRVELRTQKVTKAGDLRDALDVVIVKDDGAEQEFRNYSGGERTRIGLAFAGAFAELMQVECGLLAIDEPAFLDGAGMAALVETLRRINERVAKIVVISHDARLRDAFDSVIEVVREDGRSRIVGAPVAEAVAA